MKLLFLSPEIPTVTSSGGAIRSSFIYKELSLFAEVDVVTANRKGLSKPQTQYSGDNYLGHIDLLGTEENKQKLVQLADLSKYDFIVVRYLWLAIGLALLDESNLILDADDCILELMDLSTLEPGTIDAVKSPYVQDLSKPKLVLFSKRSTMIPWENNYRIFPNFLEEISSRANKPLDVAKCEVAENHATRDETTFTVLFVGLLNYGPNYSSLDHFIQNVWLKFSALKENAVLRICGWGLPQSLQAKWAGIPNVHYCGYVDSIDDVYADVDVSISPVTVGSGTHIKIIESLLRKVTMVISLKSHRGYEDTLLDGKSLFVATDDSDFLENLLKLESDPLLRETMAQSGQLVAQKHYTNESVKGKLRTFIEELER